MKVYEMLKLGAETLKTMSRNGIYLNDYEYLEAYERLKAMRHNGVKYDSAIIDVAANLFTDGLIWLGSKLFKKL